LKRLVAVERRRWRFLVRVLTSGSVGLGARKMSTETIGIHDGLVAGVVDLEHDIRAEGLDRVEQHGGGVEAEVALALVEDDEVLLQIHRAAREDAGSRRRW
jgi:hypothetical protein